MLGGALLLDLSFVAALYFSCRSFGAQPAVAAVAVVWALLAAGPWNWHAPSFHGNPVRARILHEAGGGRVSRGARG